jgi:hypothetical protein
MNSLISKFRYLNFRIAETLIGFPGEEVDWYYNYACSYAKGNNRELALYYLGKALPENPTFVHDARKDRDFHALWNDVEFNNLLSRHSGKTFKLREFSLKRLFLFNISAIFTIVSLIVFLLDKESGRITFEIGLVLGYIIESVQAMVFRQRVYFASLTTPLEFGTIIFSAINLVVYKEGLFPLSFISYLFVVIIGFASMPFQWFVFGPKLKEYTAYRIQNISNGSLHVTTLTFAVLRIGYLIQAIMSGNCLECVYYYSLQVGFFVGSFILVYFLFSKGVTLNRAQIASIIVTIAYLLMVSATFQSANVFQPVFLIWFVIIYTDILLLTLIISIAEVYFDSQSGVQQKITRYLVTTFWVFSAAESIYAALLFAGLMPSSFPKLETPPLSVIVVVNVTMTMALWVVFLRLKGANIVNKYISIAGVSSSSINIESPFATALTNLESSGKKEAALKLLCNSKILLVKQNFQTLINKSKPSRFWTQLQKKLKKASPKNSQ